MKIDLGPGVVDLLRGLGEESLTVELVIDFEHDVMKSAVAFPGPGEPSLGYRRHRVGGVEVWWRQRLVLGFRTPQVSDRIQPRRVVVGRVGSALSAEAQYA